MRNDESIDDLDAVDESKDSNYYCNDDDLVGGLCPLDLQNFIQNRLPGNLNWEKERKKKEKQQQQQNISEIPRPIQEFSTTTAILEENEEEDYDDDDDGDILSEQKKNEDGLVNAWQYKLSVQEERLGLKQVNNSLNSRTQNNPSNSNSPTVFCHSYDLSSKMKSDKNHILNNIRIVNCSVSTKKKYNKSTTMMKAIQFYQSCINHIQKELGKDKDTVIRVLISNGVVSILAIAMPLLLSFIRQNDLPVVILITIRPWLLSCTNSDNNIHSLHRAADAVLSCESFASNTTPVPSEFSNLIGLLYVLKMAFLSPIATTVAATSLQANRFGLKRNRRKMEISLLHLPPEEFSNNGSGSVSGGGVRSGGGGQPQRNQQTNANIKSIATGCSSHQGTSSSLLDF